jgi:hypothetical protein
MIIFNSDGFDGSITPFVESIMIGKLRLSDHIVADRKDALEQHTPGGCVSWQSKQL